MPVFAVPLMELLDRMRKEAVEQFKKDMDVTVYLNRFTHQQFQETLSEGSVAGNKDAEKQLIALQQRGLLMGWPIKFDKTLATGCLRIEAV
jgi:hypothetical protein